MFIDIPAPHGRLEGVLWEVPEPRAAAVVLHPHPQLGGTMHHHAPYRIARALRDSGLTVLRFNFRGVGRSTGHYTEGEGERDDVSAGLDFLAERAPGIPLWTAGFSFGAWVGLRVAAEQERVKAALAAGVPVEMFDHRFLKELRAPLEVIQAERDAFGSIAKVEAALREVPARKRLVTIANADHMFTGALDALESATREAVPFLSEGARPG